MHIHEQGECVNEGLWVGINMVNLFDMNVEIEGILRKDGGIMGSWWTQTNKGKAMKFNLL
jgi:hypothetical protein